MDFSTESSRAKPTIEAPIPYPPNRTIKRRASAPDLSKSFVDENPYEEGKLLKLIVSDTPQVITAKIVKCFKPFTMGQAMIVRILNPSHDSHKNYVLKLFDRRFTDSIRKQDHLEPEMWNREVDMAYHRFIFSPAHDHEYQGWLGSGHEHDEFFWSDDDDEEENEHEDEDDDAESYAEALSNLVDETYVQYQCDRMSRNEQRTYARLKDLQGRDVPRCFAEVELPLFRVSTNACAVGANTLFLHSIRGILLEYIKGFTLQDMFMKPVCPAPRKYWQEIIDDAVRIVDIVRGREILNKDSNVRNTMVRWDPIDNKYKVFLIDFSHCKAKHPTTSLHKWRKVQANEDEEGALGRYLDHKLKEKYGAGGFRYTRTDYAEALVKDFKRGD